MSFALCASCRQLGENSPRDLSGFENDFAAGVALLENPPGFAKFGQEIDFRDRDLEAAGGDQAGELREQVRGGGFEVAFRFHSVFRGGEVDDGVDSIRRCPNFRAGSTAASAEGVDF